MSHTAALVTAAAGAPLEPALIERRALRDDDVADRRQVRRHLPQRHPPGPRGVGRGHLPDGARATRSPASSSAVGSAVTKLQGRRPRRRRLHGRLLRRVRVLQGRRGAVLHQGRRADLQRHGLRRRDRRCGGYSQQVVVNERFALRHPRRHRARCRGAAAVRRHHDVQPAAAAGAPARARRSPSSAWAAWATWRSSSPRRWAPRSPCSARRSASRRTASASARRTTSPRRTRRRSDNAREQLRPHHQHGQRRPADRTPTWRCCGRRRAGQRRRCRPSRTRSRRSRSSAAAGRSPARPSAASPQTQEMLDFCAEHGIAAEIETDRRRPGQRGLRPRRQLRRALPLRHRHGDHQGLTSAARRTTPARRTPSGGRRAVRPAAVGLPRRVGLPRPAPTTWSAKQKLRPFRPIWGGMALILLCAVGTSARRAGDDPDTGGDRLARWGRRRAPSPAWSVGIQRPPSPARRRNERGRARPGQERRAGGVVR